jgi:hypothetical protein
MYPNPSPRPDTYSRVDSPPLHAVRNTNGVVNGLVKTSTTSTFPTDSQNAPNYWVDVLFTVNTGAATVPDAPSGVTATPGNGSAAVSWNAPGDGGSPITSYTVTPYIGTTAQTATPVTGTPPATSTTVTGLANGSAYTFKVVATNSVGAGAASAASNAVTPAAVQLRRVHPVALDGRPVDAGPGRSELGRAGREVQGGPERRNQVDQVLQRARPTPGPTSGTCGPSPEPSSPR